MDLLKRVEETIIKYKMIQPGDLVIVGISGGPDSLALLHILNRLQDPMSFKIQAAHLDHSFRGKEAEEEAQWVLDKCREWGIPCTINKQDVPGLAREKGLSAQDAGHQARRGFYLAILEKLGAHKIAQGHQANDQAETLLMHFLAGAGPEGLQGILPVNLPFIRPLIMCSREEIEEYCLQEGLNPRRDPSNEKNYYLRNRVRNILIPWLQENINPNLVQTLNRTADVFQAEEGEWQEKIRDLARSRLMIRESKVILDLTDWMDLSPALQRRILRRAFQVLTKFQGLGYYHVEAIRDLAGGQVGRKLPLPGGLLAVKTYKTLEILAADDQKEGAAIPVRPLLIPGDTLIPETGQTVRVSISPEQPHISSESIFIPFREKPPCLMARARQEGDRFFPRGLQGSKKLKDYFIEKKIPRQERDRILLIALGKEILWIPGLAAGKNVNNPQDNSRYLILRIVEKGTIE